MSGRMTPADLRRMDRAELAAMLGRMRLALALFQRRAESGDTED